MAGCGADYPTPCAASAISGHRPASPARYRRRSGRLRDHSCQPLRRAPAREASDDETRAASMRACQSEDRAAQLAAHRDPNRPGNGDCAGIDRLLRHAADAVRRTPQSPRTATASRPDWARWRSAVRPEGGCRSAADAQAHERQALRLGLPRLLVRQRSQFTGRRQLCQRYGRPRTACRQSPARAPAAEFLAVAGSIPYSLRGRSRTAARDQDHRIPCRRMRRWCSYGYGSQQAATRRPAGSKRPHRQEVVLRPRLVEGDHRRSPSPSPSASPYRSRAPGPAPVRGSMPALRPAPGCRAARTAKNATGRSCDVVKPGETGMGGFSSSRRMQRVRIQVRTLVRMPEPFVSGQSRRYPAAAPPRRHGVGVEIGDAGLGQGFLVEEETASATRADRVRIACAASRRFRVCGSGPDRRRAATGSPRSR